MNEVTGSQHRAFYRNAIWQYILQGIKYLLPLITLPYLTRVLEPEGYAVYAYVVSFMSFAQTFIDFGFNLSGTKEVAEASTMQELGLVTGRITQARLLLCVLAGLGCAIIGSAIPIMRDNVAYAVLAYIAVCGRGLAPDFLFQGKERMAPITLRYLVSKSTSTALTFVFVHSVSDLYWVPILDILASAIALAWSFSAARRLFGLHVLWGKPREIIRELAKSGYYCLSNMASTAFSCLITLLIGVAISDAAQISYWSLAMTPIGAVKSLYAPIINSLYPHMVAGGDFNFAKKLIMISIPFVLIGTAAFVLLSRIIVLFLGGPEYLEGAYVLRLVSPVLVFSFYGMIMGWPILGAMGKVRELTRTTVLSSIASVAMLLGAMSLGWASVSTFAIIRSTVEVLMCLMRGWECARTVRD